MNFFIGILFFLLIIDHICILAPKEFVDISKKKVIAQVLKVSDGKRENFFFLN